MGLISTGWLRAPDRRANLLDERGADIDAVSRKRRKAKLPVVQVDVGNGVCWSRCGGKPKRRLGWEPASKRSWTMPRRVAGGAARIRPVGEAISRHLLPAQSKVAKVEHHAALPTPSVTAANKAGGK